MSERKYRPSNGSEGECFLETYCYHCIHDNGESKICDILCRTMCFGVTEKEYPEEWTYDEKGNPICTNYKKWDWGNDGDPDDPENPKHIPPDDPNQLCFPFIFDEIGVPKHKNQFA